MYFQETEKKPPLNITNWDRIEAVIGESDTNEWPDHRVTLYKDTYWNDAAGEARPCVRVSTIKPAAEGNGKEATATPATGNTKPVPKVKLTPAAKKKPPSEDLFDEVPNSSGEPVLRTALTLAARGCAVLPCRERSKLPATSSRILRRYQRPRSN